MSTTTLQEFQSKAGKSLKGAGKAHTARLTPAKVNKIRESKESLAALSKHYKMSITAICAVRNRRSYAYIP